MHVMFSKDCRAALIVTLNTESPCCYKLYLNMDFLFALERQLPFVFNFLEVPLQLDFV